MCVTNHWREGTADPTLIQEMMNKFSCTVLLTPPVQSIELPPKEHRTCLRYTIQTVQYMVIDVLLKD
jgi:hypothetical protein